MPTDSTALRKEAQQYRALAEQLGGAVMFKAMNDFAHSLEVNAASLEEAVYDEVVFA